MKSVLTMVLAIALMLTLFCWAYLYSVASYHRRCLEGSMAADCIWPAH